MFRYLLSSRLIQVGLVFCVLVVGSSLLYSGHVRRTTEKEFGKIPQPVSSIENKQSTSTAPVTFESSGVVNTPDENSDTPMSDDPEAETIDETELLDMADAFLPEDFVSEEEVPAEDVPVSPFGFGPYPEVPADYPSNRARPLWLWSEEKVAQLEKVIQGSLERRGISFRDHMKTSELLGRLSIQLWNEGRDFDGITTLDQTGLFYPDEPDVLYVRWGETKHPTTGEVRRYISQAIGSAYASLSVAETQGREPLPDWIEVRSLSEGINPYEYLGLSR